ncbi:MAG: FAD-dependent oxidoreductase, partial [Candidatus Caldatribacteriota bacterium]|nr:FAD-dependent oxidoreductase [Candidatus Caldatribacteriota bacterium]
MNEVDITIIGGGPAGYVAAIRAAHLGLKAVLIEKDKLGGVCLNRGCIPTKTLVSTAELFTNIKRASEFGIDIENPVLNFPKAMARKDRIVHKLSYGVGELVKANRVKIIKGEGNILKPGVVQIIDDKGFEEKINTENILIATGSSVTIIPIPGLEL